MILVIVVICIYVCTEVGIRVGLREAGTSASNDTTGFFLTQPPLQVLMKLLSVIN